MFDERADLGLPFVIGTAKGIDPARVRAVFSQPADPPGVAGQWKQLRLRFLDGLGRNDLIAFATDRDEADAIGPAGRWPAARRTCSAAACCCPRARSCPTARASSAAFEDGTQFQGRMHNEIGTGYSPLDGYGFINAERAVNAVLKD